MDWTEIRKQARAQVHQTFARMVTYTPKGGGAGTPVSVRLHTRLVTHGDLDREGYSQTVEEVERVVFITIDAVRAGVGRGGTITTKDGQKYRLELRDPQRDPQTIEYQVLRADS